MGQAQNAAYRTMQANCNLEVGDQVQCTGHFDANQGGSKCKSSDYHWTKEEFVDDCETGIVEGLKKHSIRVRSEDGENAWNFPCFMLRKVGSKKVIEKRYVMNGVDVTNELSDETKRRLDRK